MSDTAEDGALDLRPASDTPDLRGRLTAIGEILLCSGVPTQAALGIALSYFGRLPGNGSEGGLTLMFVVAVTLPDTIILIALMTLLTRARGESARALWLGRRPFAREAAVGLLLVPAVFAIVIVLLNGLRLLAPWLHNVETNPLERLAGNSAIDAALFAVVAIFAGGVREELQRAFILRRFDCLGGPAVGVIVSSTAFGAGHWMQGWDAVITTGALGAFWAVIYLRRGSSVAPVVSHAGFNSLEILRVALMG